MSALNFLKITDRKDERLSFVKALYQSAFPVQERREWPVLLSMIGTGAEMRVELVTDQEQPVAFVIWWEISDWLFIEHLAVSSAERGKNYGSRIMHHYLDAAKGKMLLEVEAPLSEEAERRISFYERLGLHLLDYVYEQPSYRDRGVVYPMRLMSTCKDLLDRPVFDQLVEQIKAKVYFI
ncbi:GNAT family N-acetyltransferase [Pedobacter sp.]|jgi:GNAT superfamily N-acetyltransferase|uniref:GNAT family N-acetyltransferase n=1 Tax=Pedobacter sp. TaxID=1411316 RepID=UPI002CBB1AF7|nr:GNAT family N-acetyltransferase [Pedobacter sp.]HWW40270.1 GNAT family N-acetyltransferase [Pedobacter sp.]